MHCLLLKVWIYPVHGIPAAWANDPRHHVSLPEMRPMILEPTWIENKAGFLTWSAYDFCLFAPSHCSYVKHGVSNSHLERISAVWLCGILCRIKLSVLFNKETLSYSLTIKIFWIKKVHLPKPGKLCCILICFSPYALECIQAWVLPEVVFQFCFRGWMPTYYSMHVT